MEVTAACWNIKSISDNRNITDTQSDIQNKQTKETKADCVDEESEESEEAVRMCDVCFESSSQGEHAENELEVTQQRD